MEHLLTYTIDQEGIAIITIDQKKNATNLFTFEFIHAYYKVAQELISKEEVVGVIVTSAQPVFVAGADLNELFEATKNPEEFYQQLLSFHKESRVIETGGKPFVAALNGTALGGGFEMALTCHHRIALNNPKAKFGFPEVTLGLLPGGGGTSKIPYLMGIEKALDYLLKGKQVNAQRALEDGLIDSIADSMDAVIAKAKEYIIKNKEPLQPWDNKKHRIPGGGLMSPKGFQTMMGAAGNVTKMTHGNYPAAQYILSILHDGLGLVIDRALEVEARYMTKVIQTKQAQNMIRTGFLGMQAARKGKAKPKGFEPVSFKKLGVLGAGMMGAGIAYISAKAGMEVVLKDVNLEAAEKGKAYSQKILEKAIAKGRTTEEKAGALLDRIKTTIDSKDFEGCDMVIEAVFEDQGLKAKVTAEVEAVLGKDKIFASNTSTIPITDLAKVSERPDNFIGIHFFSPVDKMPLVEIIVGKETSDKTVAAAIDYVMAVRKVPIVVNDSRGFYTSRSFSTYCAEGVYLLEEGVSPIRIENIAKKAGMPVGPLAVMDEVSLGLIAHIHESDPNSKSDRAMRNYKVIKKMTDDYDRIGKKTGKGFYDYPEGEKKRIWKELFTIFNSKEDYLEEGVIRKRIMHVQAMEAYRCLEEGVLNSVTDGDIGSVLGWGVPMYTGGALSYIDFVGIQNFVAECDQFTEEFGPRFEVPNSLRELAKNAKSIHSFKS